MKFLITSTFLLIAITWLLDEMEVKAERRTFDFFKKHHHKHRKEDDLGYYLDDNEFDGYHDSDLHKRGYYPSVHLNSYGVHGYGIGETGFHGGIIQSSGIHGSNFYGGNVHRGYFSGNHFGSPIFNDGFENNLLHVQDDEVHGNHDGVHKFVSNHGNHLSHFG